MTNQLLLIDIATDKTATDKAGRRTGKKARRRAASGSAVHLAASQGTANIWPLDTATCETGRRGVAQARQALRAARSEAWDATAPAPDLPAAA